MNEQPINGTTKDIVEIAPEVLAQQQAEAKAAQEETVVALNDDTMINGKPVGDDLKRFEETHEPKVPDTLGEEQAPLSNGRTIEELMQDEAKEAEEKPASSFSLNRTLGGIIMTRMIQRQIWLVLLITVFLIIYINNRYMCQKQVVKIDKLEKELVEVHYKATVYTSVLTEKSRESSILNMLQEKGDTTLSIPKDPPFLIKVTK